jgi:hypothetical protein
MDSDRAIGEIADERAESLYVRGSKLGEVITRK